MTTILGRKNRPHHRKRKPQSWQVAVERPCYDLTIFKVHCGKVALKIYTKGEPVLRAEAMANDARELRCGRDIGQFAKAVTKLREILERFLEALSWMDQCFVSEDVLENFRLKVFRAVAQQLSLRKAAEELYITQPAVTLQVKALEEEVGAKLFDPGSKGVALTEAGILLLRYADQLHRLALQAEAARKPAGQG